MRSSPSSPSRSPPSRPLVATLQAHPSNRYTPRCATLISARDLLSPPASALSQSITSSRSQASWHYLGSITNECPTVVFHTRLVWSARDAIPTRVQLGVELQPKAQMAQRPPEKVCPLTRKHTANTLALTRSRACDFPLTPRTRAHTELVCTETPRRIFAATCALRCQPR